MSDWINQFVEATETVRSPKIFRLWSAIGAIAAALERRVYTMTDVSRLYPNMYIVLVGEPAAGKTNSAREARKTLAGNYGLHLGPDNPTKASFMDQLALSVRITGHAHFMAMTALVEEFGVFIPSYDEEFLADLSHIFDNPETYTSPRRASKSIKLERPTLNILACATPAVIGKFPEAAWGEGFTSRVLFIYGSRVEETRDAFKPRENLNLENLRTDLKSFFNEIHGQFDWDEDARLAFNDWINTGMKPRPDYGRLKNYCGRRDTHLMKLAMISAVSAGHGLNVTLNDFNRAKTWLLDAEEFMPDVFRAMKSQSDEQLLGDLHHHISNIYNKLERQKRSPIKNEVLWNYLLERVPSERIQKVIETAEHSGYIRRAGGFDGDAWIPQPRQLH